MRQSGQILHLNKYLHPTHYINNMTFTIQNHKRFVLKEGRTLFSGNAFFWTFFCFFSVFLQREYNCISFSICPFYYQKCYCAAGWTVAWTGAFMPLARSPGSPAGRERVIFSNGRAGQMSRGNIQPPVLIASTSARIGSKSRMCV